MWLENNVDASTETWIVEKIDEIRIQLGRVLCSDVRSTMLCTFEPSDRTSDDLDLISTTNGSRLLVAKMRSEPSDA